MVFSLSSFDIHHIVAELQFVVGGKIEKIFQSEKPAKEFLFSLHIPNHGKEYFFISLPSICCVSSFKPVFPDVPPHFCSSLRRKITNARINTITQIDFERIVQINLSTAKGESYLIIELFANGNIILTDTEYKILAVFQPKIWNETRRILPNQTYVFPPSQINPLRLEQSSFNSLCGETEKESLVTFLAIDCSLGGMYAKEILVRASLDEQMRPNQLSDKQLEILFASLYSVVHEKTNPHTDEKRPYPIEMKSLKTQSLDISFIKSIGDLALVQAQHVETTTTSASTKKALTKYEKIITSQSLQVEQMRIKSIEAQKKAECIYTNYQTIALLLERINELRKTKSWKEIKELAKDVPLIEKIDETKGLIYINVEDKE